MAFVQVPFGKFNCMLCALCIYAFNSVGVIDFFQGELIFLFIISISLHNLRIVSGFFLLNNDNSFNMFGHFIETHNLDN
jgi:hypothetical protein